MNSNQNIQYQALLNRNIGTNMETDNLTVQTLQVNGDATIDGVLTATNPLSTVSRSNQVYLSNDNGNHFNPIVYFQNAGTLVDGYKSLDYDSALTLVFNPNTHEFRITGSGSNLHLHNTATLTADSTGSFAGLLTCSNGNNVQGTNYSAYFGTSNSKSAQLVLWDGLASNQYAQVYCRSNVFGVQGNITSIALQKNTNITGNLTVSGTGIITGQLTATANTSSTVSQSNLINITDTTDNVLYSLIFNTPAPGYKSLFSNVNLKYQPTLQRLYTPNLTISTDALVSGSLTCTNLIVNTGLTLPDYTITNNMLFNNYIQLNGQAMSLGSNYTIPNTTITNAMLVNSSITIGSTSVSLGGTLTTLTGMTGNISTSTGYLQSLTGGSNIITPSSSTGSLLLGLSSINDGVIKISSASGAIASKGSFIQQNNGDLYIDNSGTSSINIGTIGSTTVTNLGKSNFNVNPTFTNMFNNIQKTSISGMSYTTSIGLTSWAPIGHTATNVLLQTSITAKSSTSYIRITINIPLSNWGTAASNHHLSIRRSTTAMTYGTLYATELIGGNYGLQHILSGIQYESFSGTFIDTSSNTIGTTYYYCVVGRSNTVATIASNIGNTNYSDITVEELF